MNNPHYRLVWSDEFDYEGPPDPQKWNYNMGGSGWGNNELQYYTDSNASVRGGRLVIEARNETLENRTVTSARLTTKGKGDWLYGRVEVCARLPKGLGTWPAIWMLPTEDTYGRWPSSGEIDIMEHVGYDYGRIYATVHTAAYNHVKGTQKGGSRVYDDIDTAFHVYAAEWLPDRIRFLVDGDEIFVFKPDDFNKDVTDQSWPFNKPFHLLINLAFGGNWGGAKGVDYAVLPAVMEIDYVRVYQTDGD